MSTTKRNITIVAVLLCVCAAVYLNWSYNNRSADEAMADAELANAKTAEETMGAENPDVLVSDYFAEARLTRQQSRDEAISLLQAAAASETASKETIDSAVNTIAVMANYSMLETQIENLLIAKNFADCVAFMSAEGVTLAVPSPAEGLTAEAVAKITDAIVSETDFNATQITIIEVKGNEITAKDADTKTGEKASETGDKATDAEKKTTDSTEKDKTAETGNAETGSQSVYSDEAAAQSGEILE